MRKRIAVISDMQCGSLFGMLPAGFIMSDGVEKLQNYGQRFLWDCWLDFLIRFRKFAPDIIILNGDLIDGKQQAQRGTELSLPLVFDQRRAAVACLAPFRKASPSARWFAVQGTEYHVGKSAEHEEEIAKELNCEKYRSLGTGIYVREVLWLDIDGVVIEASHHISVTQGFYRLTALDREMQWSAMAAKDNSKGVPKADLLIRSHVHNFHAAEHASKQGVVTPCWQLQTRFMRKNSVYRMIPDIGGVFITVDPDKKKRGEACCEIRKKLYPLPPIEPVAVGQ